MGATVHRLKRRMTTVLVTAAVLTATTMLAACTKDETVAPAFLHVEGIKTYIPTSGAFSTDSAFYRSDIVAAYVVAKYPGAGSVDTIGLFRLPFTVPVLHNGPVEYINLYPAVEQSGVSGALPFYTFYNHIHREGLSLTAGDTLDMGVDSTTYSPLCDTVQLFEPFERPSDHIRFDSILQWVDNDPAGACTGYGYGMLQLNASQTMLSFATEDLFYVPSATKIVYLELDIKSEIPLQVYMHSTYIDGGSEDQLPVMMINPIDHWQHLYINLGRTWAYFNHRPTFRLSFSAINQDAIDGAVRIDNVKLITTDVSI